MLILGITLLVGALILGIVLMEISDDDNPGCMFSIVAFFIGAMLIFFSLILPVELKEVAIPHKIIEVEEKQWISYDGNLTPYDGGTVTVLKSTGKYRNGKPFLYYTVEQHSYE